MTRRRESVREAEFGERAKCFPAAEISKHSRAMGAIRKARRAALNIPGTNEQANETYKFLATAFEITADPLFSDALQALVSYGLAGKYAERQFEKIRSQLSLGPLVEQEMSVTDDRGLTGVERRIVNMSQTVRAIGDQDPPDRLKKLRENLAKLEAEKQMILDQITAHDGANLLEMRKSVQSACELVAARQQPEFTSEKAEKGDEEAGLVTAIKEVQRAYSGYRKSKPGDFGTTMYVMELGKLLGKLGLFSKLAKTVPNNIHWRQRVSSGEFVRLG